MAPVSVGSSAPFHARRPSSHAHHHRRFSSSLSENGLLSGLTSAADSDVEESRIPTPEPLQSSGKVFRGVRCCCPSALSVRCAHPCMIPPVQPSNSEVTRQRSVTEAVVMDSLKSSRSAGSSASLLDMVCPSMKTINPWLPSCVIHDLKAPLHSGLHTVGTTFAHR